LFEVNICAITVEMSATSAVTKMKERKEKKDKKEKKAKKQEAEPVEVEMSNAPAKETPAAASPSAPREKSPSPTGDEDPQSPSKKRKLSVDEIEVDVTAPEPPSKKQLRQLKKGKPLPKSKTIPGDVANKGANSEDEDDTPREEEKAKRSEFGVWVGNLPWSISRDDLKKFLTSNAAIGEDAITRIHMPSPDDGRPGKKEDDTRPNWKKQHNKGYAYVDFSEQGCIQQAIALSEQLLGGRRVLIKDSKSYEGRPDPKIAAEEKKQQGHPPSKRVFLGNLRYDATKENITEHFEKCGEIEDCMIATFEDSGKCKGYGWITFAELEVAEACVRGFVFVEEEQDEDQDMEDGEEEKDSDDSEDEDKEEEEKEKKVAAPKPKLRKWFVDKIHRRPVRREFAEDAKVRYAKRFGKDAPPKDGANEGGKEERKPRREKKPRSEAAGEGDAPKDVKTVSGRIEARKVEYRSEYAPRLTGGIVESKGKKVTF
jgi:RNA recognition motif-containing protein